VIEDQLVLTDQREKSEIQVVLALLVCKDFVVFQAAPDPLASLVALVNVVYPVLTARSSRTYWYTRRTRSYGKYLKKYTRK
jgi:hypothetical protein